MRDKVPEMLPTVEAMAARDSVSVPGEAVPGHWADPEQRQEPVLLLPVRIRHVRALPAEPDQAASDI